MPSTRINKVKSSVSSEVCWWGQTRLALEEVFRKPRLTGTFPFTAGYDVLTWPSAVVAALTVALNILGVNYSLGVKLSVNIFDISIVRIIKCFLTTTCNIISPIWMICNHKCVLQILKSIASVERELDKASLKWNWKFKHIPFFLLPGILAVLTIAQSTWFYLESNFLNSFSFTIVVIIIYPLLSHVWQYCYLHDVLRSLMNAISELGDVDSFVNCYHALVLAYRAVDKLYGIQIIIYCMLSMQVVIHSLHYTFSDNAFDFMFVCQILWTCFYTFVLLLIIRGCNSSMAEVSYFLF